jgi:hypothetical protein
VVGLVQKFYVCSPLGDLNPLSSLSIKNPTSIFNWPDNWQHRENTVKIYPAGRQSGSYKDVFEMMVRQCGRCVPSHLFLGATQLKSRKKKKSTDKQTDLMVIWDTKSTKTVFLSNPKSVDRKTKNSTDEQTDSQQIWFFWTHTLINLVWAE